MPDKLIELASNPEYSELILAALIAIISFLGARAIKAQDDKIKQNREEIDQLRKEHDAEIQQVVDSVKTLTNAFSAQSIKTAEDFGEVKGQLGQIIGMMKLLTKDK